MSTSVLYQAVGIRGYKHRSIRGERGRIVLRARHDGKKLECSKCGGARHAAGNGRAGFVGAAGRQRAGRGVRGRAPDSLSRVQSPNV